MARLIPQSHRPHPGARLHAAPGRAAHGDARRDACAGRIVHLVSARCSGDQQPGLSWHRPPRDFHHVDPLRQATSTSPTSCRFAPAPSPSFGSATMQGIITFPSYHAGLSLVTLWGFWASRMAWLRWPGMLLAALTIVATPVDGGALSRRCAGWPCHRRREHRRRAIAPCAGCRRWPRLTASPFRH